MQPKVIRKLKINEISLVDRGANQHAHVVLVKRDTDAKPAPASASEFHALAEQIAKGASFDEIMEARKQAHEAEELMMKFRDNLGALRMSIDSILYDPDEDDKVGAIEASMGQFIKSLKRTASDDVAEMMEKLLTTSAGNGSTPKEADMPETDLQKQIDALSAELVGVRKQAEAAGARVSAALGLSPEEHAYAASLEGESLTKFLDAANDGRTEIMKADESVEIDGVKLLKRDVSPAVLALLEKQSDRVKKAEASAAEAEQVKLEKRAGDELPNLGGDTSTRVAIVKALDGIEDEDTRKAARELLKNAGAGMFEEIGKSHGGTKLITSDSPEGKLEALAKAHQADKGCSYHDAYDAVIHTDEGRELYRQSVQN